MNMSPEVILSLIGISLICLASLLASIPISKKKKGKVGEELTEGILKKLSKKNDINGRILRNVYIPKPDGGTSEIDVLYITTKGIFVIESKNYSGWIFGKEYDDYWTATLPAGKGRSIKNKFYNPIKQNKGHIKYLSDFLQKEYPDKGYKLFSLIVFSERCKFKDISIKQSTYVMQRNVLYSEMNKILKDEEISLTNVQVDELYEKLNGLSKVDKDVKQNHIKAIQDKQPKKEKEVEPIESLKCPVCGNDLVLRTAKRGVQKGNKFYGCSAYPKCKYIQNVD